MRSSNGVIWIVCRLGTTNNVSPPRTDSSTSWYVDDSVVLVINSSIAGKLGVVDVFDGVVRVWGTNTLQLALVDTIDRDFLERG